MSLINRDWEERPAERRGKVMEGTTNSVCEKESTLLFTGFFFMEMQRQINALHLSFGILNNKCVELL